jgi:signal transduction histidine kinase
MTRRLVLSYLGLALLILVVLEIPLAVLAARHEQDMSASQAEAEASGLAAVASDDVEHGRIADLTALLGQYQSRTGQEVAIINPAGKTLAAAGTDKDNDSVSSARNLVQAALAGRSVTSFSSDEGQPWASAAVPINADGRALGAVVLGVTATATERRIHTIWMALAFLAAGVVGLTGLVGLLLARSLSRPLARLEGVVTRLGQGDLTARAQPDSGPPQVRSLARQFNHMASRLAELVDAQSRFVADASHQLRSPLTALRLRLENLQVESSGPFGEGVAAAGEEVQRLSRLVDGLLTLSRADRPQPHRQPVDVEKIIQDRCDAWSALADERRVELEPPRYPSRHATALLVPGDLEQILDNLLANALDASPEGGRIQVTIEDRQPGSLQVHVRDEGPGMSEEDRRRAFDRFWQGPNSQGGHSGLGLAIVRQLAARNDASVELRPAQPTGLDAVVRLARTRSPESKESARKSHQPQPSTRQPVRQ